MPSAFRPALRHALWVILLAAIGVLAFFARCHNWRQTLIARHLYFVDGDCYARMTRVRMVLEHPGLIIHHHEFENYPEGVNSHTTAPFDYAIAALKGVVEIWFRFLPGEIGRSALRTQTLDVAGALISPLLGALTSLYLGWWGRWWLGGKLAGLAPALFFAVCPILVHGTILGRPDHQSGIILLLAVALTAELSLLGEGSSEKARRAWAIAAGVSWGFALWLSLFEPLLLLLGMLAWLALFERPALRRPERFWEGGLLLLILLLMLLLEGSPIPHLSPAVKEYFARWSQTVGELNHLDPRGSLLYRWLGLGCVAAPALIILAARKDRRAWPVLVLLLAMFAATCDHLRWGYFLGLAYAISLPWQFALLRWRWLAWLLLLASFYPLAQEWDEQLYPNEQEELQRGITRQERVLLRDIAEHMKSPGNTFPFLAPWWLSPALAYWSGQPGVAGSSHEGLGGIVDTARFFLTLSPAEAADILDKRGVAYVILDDPVRTKETSAPLLGVTAPEWPMGRSLYDAPHSAPGFLTFRYENQYYKLFSVDITKLHP